MTDDEILTQLTEVFRNVFGDPAIELQPETSAGDIPEWDSMSQVTLAIEVEHCFNVAIKSAEMEELQGVRELIALIKARLPAPAI
jgi:acyl carrier protein